MTGELVPKNLLDDLPTVVSSYHEQNPLTGEYVLVEVLSDDSVKVGDNEPKNSNY